jgi:hypothetical protein
MTRTPTREWLLIVAGDDSGIGQETLDALIADHSPGVTFWVDNGWLGVGGDGDNPDPLHLHGLSDDCQPWDEDCQDLLLRVEQTSIPPRYREPNQPFDELDHSDQDGVEVVEYEILAAHSPKDAYAAQGTRLREVLDLLGGPDQADIVHRKWYGSDAVAVDRDHFESCKDAAENALRLAGRNTNFPGSCLHGEEFLALAARGLIGSVLGWDRAAYDCLRAPFERAAHQRLHPHDGPALVSEGGSHVQY